LSRLFDKNAFTYFYSIWHLVYALLSI